MPCSQMMSMNIRPPRLSEARKLATLPALKARMRKSESRNIGLGHLGLDDPEGDEDRQPAEDLRHHDRAGPAHGVAAVGQQPVGDADEDEDQSDGEGEVAQPVDLGRRPHAAVLELHVGPDGARRCRRAPRSGRRGATARARAGPPRTRPMKEPATAATLLMPSPRPRLSAGKASVMIADELAKSMAPPTPWPTRIDDQPDGALRCPSATSRQAGSRRW